ncbi:MAG TPA: hemerythrin domain-containing protein [Terriglobales bacterium]|jgi:regulator of cell morphogenesis and NO signaling
MSTETPDWSQSSLATLAAHIVARHHVYCREQLPRLEAMFAEAAAESGGRYATLPGLHKSFHRLSGALTSHLMKEESVLFPLIERIEAAQRGHTPPPQSSFGSVGNPIRMMVLEHSEAESVLAQMRAATDGFRAPPEAGARMRALCDALREFDADMARHVELEDKFLFPRAIAAEEAAQRG